MFLFYGNPKKYFYQYAEQLRKTKTQDTIWYGAVNYSDFHKKEWFNETIKCEFEDGYYNIPKDFDKVLTSRYGDYMKLPPEKDRVTNHFQIAYYR